MKTDEPQMSITEAAQILLKYGSGAYGRPGTAYGIESGCGILKCTCCGRLFHAGSWKHEDDCKLQAARKIVKESGQEKTNP